MSKNNTPAINHKPIGDEVRNAPTFTANGKALTLRPVLDDWGCKARDLGRLLEYSNDGKNLLRKITTDWSDEMTEGVDFIRGSDGVSDSETPIQAHELILTRSGINLVCILSKKPLGKEIRRWLASDVMVKIADTGAYVAPNASLPAGVTIDANFFVSLMSSINSTLNLLTQTLERQNSRPAPAPEPDPLAERRALEAEAKRREISEKRREAGRKGGLVTAERYRRDTHGRFAPKASAPPRPPTQTKIPLAPPLPAPSQSGPPGQVQIVQRKVEGEPDLVRAARIASELAQPFYRYEFSIAMWPLDPYSPRRCDMVLERLQGDGQVEPVQRRTNGGALTTCYLYTGEGTAKRVA